MRLEHRIRIDGQRGDYVLDLGQLIARLQIAEPQRVLDLLDKLQVGRHPRRRVEPELDRRSRPARPAARRAAGPAEAPAPPGPRSRQAGEQPPQVARVRAVMARPARSSNPAWSRRPREMLGQPAADRRALGVGDAQVPVRRPAAARRRTTSPPTVPFTYDHKTCIQSVIRLVNPAGLPQRRSAPRPADRRESPAVSRQGRHCSARLATRGTRPWLADRRARGLLHVPPGSGRADPEPGREAGERIAFAQVDQDQEGLLPGVRLPPQRADPDPVAADDPGREVQGLTRGAAAKHGRKPCQPLVVVMKRFLSAGVRGPGYGDAP